MRTCATSTEPKFVNVDLANPHGRMRSAVGLTASPLGEEMALVQCPECERTVSSQALTCPHCGLPTPAGVLHPAAGDRTVSRPERWPFSPLFPETESVAESLERTFASFDVGTGRLTPTWNWAAFFFPIPWYFIKGLWAKGLIMVTVLWVLVDNFYSGTTLTVLVLAIYAGLFAKFDLYVWRRSGKQLW